MSDEDRLTKRWLAILLVILAVGAALRVVRLREAPPGLNQDEAANAWNAYCLLRTGQDQAGEHWPVFSSRCLGENRSTLYLYYLIPFQAVGGLSIWTLRFASAVSGVVAIALIYYVGAKLFSRPAGLLAAAMLAITPWAIQQSRWGHEAAIVPMLMLLPVAAWLWAGLPFGDESSRQRWWRAGLAGLVTGICCYGYPVVRMVLPLLGVLAAAMMWGHGWQWLRTRGGLKVAFAFVIGVGLTFGPLAYMHLTQPEVMNKRLAQTRVWQEGDSLWAKAESVLERYPGHFGFDFLFFRGDVSEFQSPPMSGLFHAYMLPLMVLGIVGIARRWGGSPSVRLLAAWLLTYPVGDCLSAHVAGSLHALRSLPGLPALVLLGAAGAVWGVEWVSRWPSMRRMGIFGVTAAAAMLQVVFLVSYFGEYNARADIQRSYHADLVAASEWLAPRLGQYDAVFCTTERTNMPYVVILVAMDYAPRQWFADSREMRDNGAWDLYRRVGKMRFVFEPTQWDELEALRANGRKDRVAFILAAREEVTPERAPGIHPVQVIRSPNGNALLWICEAEL